jgi:hypothetical protein
MEILRSIIIDEVSQAIFINKKGNDARFEGTDKLSKSINFLGKYSIKPMSLEIKTKEDYEAIYKIFKNEDVTVTLINYK